MEYLVWIGVMILAVLFEAATAGALVAIWFMPAALVCMVLSLCNVSLWVQLPVFAVLPLLFIFFIRPTITSKLKKTKTNVDAIVGERAIVIDRVENIAGCGQVKVKGQYWSARSLHDDIPLEAGDIVTVVAVEGVKLICK